jgi:hypothetical protein
MKLNPTFLEIILTLLLSLAFYIWVKYGKRIRRWWKDLHKRYRRPRQLKPREPGDCPLCARGIHQLPKRPRREVVPWSQIKSPCGRKKSVDTAGYACLSPLCVYFGITDPAIHALVSNGNRGANKDIPYFKCQACGSCKSSRLNTPMYCLKTPIHRVAMVMHALSEGLDISAASRIFGHHHSTISRWLERGGQHSARLHEQLFFRAVEVGHLQLDELVTRVKKNAERVWVWTAVTAKSKLILAVHLGGRTIGDACCLLHHVSTHLAPGCLPVFSSDGLNQYFYAITAHFGFWDKPPRARKFHWFPDERLQYAQLRKLAGGAR